MKKKAGSLKYTESLLLIVLWIIVFAAPLFIFQAEDSRYWEKVLFVLFGVLPFFLIFLANHFLLVPFLLFKNKKVFYLVSTVLLILIFSVSIHYLERLRPKPPPPHLENIQHPPQRGHERMNPPDRLPSPPQRKPNPFPYPPFINSFLICVLIVGFDTGLRMMVRWSRLEQEKTLLEKENVQNQLAFLQNQVSPHFFMNTLNNIHALIDVDTEEAKEAIIKLSKLMRHLLYDSQVELVSLNKEIEFIQSYINLMRLRFSDNVNIKLSLPDQIPDKSIPPLLFTSFVENAFKHGISYQNPTFIDIAFSFAPEQLTFEIKNICHKNNSENGRSGIGIENTRKRLDIIYGKKYSLKIDDNIDDFSVILKIPV